MGLVVLIGQLLKSASTGADRARVTVNRGAVVHQDPDSRILRNSSLAAATLLGKLPISAKRLWTIAGAGVGQELVEPGRRGSEPARARPESGRYREQVHELGPAGDRARAERVGVNTVLHRHPDVLVGLRQVLHCFRQWPPVYSSWKAPTRKIGTLMFFTTPGRALGEQAGGSGRLFSIFAL